MPASFNVIMPASFNTKDSELLAGLHKLRGELRGLKEEIRQDRSVDPQSARRIESNIHSLNRVLSADAEHGPGLIRRAEEVPSKEAHYERNQFMPVSDLPQSPEMAEKWGWDDSVAASCHQFTSPDRSNIKFVSPDGKSEVIFDQDGHIVTASEDYGTYNFVDSRQDPVGHFYQDVLPWLLWGNDEMDSTDMRQRLKALVVYGGIESLLSHAEKDASSLADKEALLWEENKMKQKAYMTETKIYIGLNDAVSHEQKFDTSKYVNILKDVCQSYSVPFSFSVFEGGYMHENGVYTDETSLVISLIDADEKVAEEMAKDLCVFFHQESVLITEDKVRAYFVKENLEQTDI